MMRPLDLVMLILATYYASVTLARLDGPFGLARRAREAVFQRRGFEMVTPEDWGRLRDGAQIDDDWLAAGVSCPLCLSLYSGAALALVWFAGGAVGQAAVVVLAVAGGASVLFSLGRYW